MIHEVIFNSETCPAGKVIELACGYCSLTKIFFEKEGMAVEIESKTGGLAFYNGEGQKLLETKVSIPPNGDEKLSELKCIAEGTTIKLGVPQYTYKDNYPHCDGEHDRWTKILSGFAFLTYDLQNNCIGEAE